MLFLLLVIELTGLCSLCFAVAASETNGLDLNYAPLSLTISEQTWSVTFKNDHPLDLPVLLHKGRSTLRDY